MFQLHKCSFPSCPSYHATLSPVKLTQTWTGGCQHCQRFCPGFVGGGKSNLLYYDSPPLPSCASEVAKQKAHLGTCGGTARKWKVYGSGSTILSTRSNAGLILIIVPSWQLAGFSSETPCHHPNQPSRWRPGACSTASLVNRTWRQIFCVLARKLPDDTVGDEMCWGGDTARLMSRPVNEPQEGECKRGCHLVCGLGQSHRVRDYTAESC